MYDLVITTAPLVDAPGIELVRPRDLPASSSRGRGDWPCRLGLAAMEAQAPDATFAVLHDGEVRGYTGLLPGAAGFAYGSLYVPDGLRRQGVGAAVTAALFGIADELGLEALGGNPTTEEQYLFTKAMGMTESGVELPDRGPIMLRRRRSSLSDAQVAEGCFYRIVQQVRYLERLKSLIPAGGMACLERA
ncbi:MAG: hypothetical protein IPM60_14685 [Rhodospirillales bacterium]|nr:hypothetical protein [Rhodospirillales bacterium]